MDQDHPMSVETSVTIKKIGDALASVREWDQFKQQQPLSVKQVDMLAVDMRKLESEMGRLCTKLRYRIKVLKTIEDADERHYIDGREKIDLLLSWGDLIEDILKDLSLCTTPTISSLPPTVIALFTPLLNPCVLNNNHKPTLTTPQKRLRTLHETVLKSATSLALATASLSAALYVFAMTVIPYTADSAATDCSRLLTRCPQYTAKDSFRTAQQSVHKLTGLFVKLASPGSEEEARMGWYVSKIFILLRVLENYFYPPHSEHRRCDIFGNPEQWSRLRGLPIAGVNMFNVGEIGGILAGILGAGIILKVGVVQPGGGTMSVLRPAERRMGVLKRCLVFMWKRELAWVAKVKWLRSPRRVVRRVKRKMGEAPGEGGEEKREGVAAPMGTPETAQDWEVQAARRAFQTPDVGKTPSVAQGAPKAPVDNPLKREKDSNLGTAKAPSTKGELRATAPDGCEVGVARKESQSSGMRGGPTKGVGAPATADGAKNGRAKEEAATETVQVQAEVGGKKKKKKKKGGKKHGRDH